MITALLLVSRILEFIPHDIYTVPDPYLEIGGGVGGGGGQSPKKHFLALWGLVQKKGGPGPPGPSPRSATATYKFIV